MKIHRSQQQISMENDPRLQLQWGWPHSAVCGGWSCTSSWHLLLKRTEFRRLSPSEILHASVRSSVRTLETLRGFVWLSIPREGVKNSSWASDLHCKYQQYNCKCENRGKAGIKEAEGLKDIEKWGLTMKTEDKKNQGAFTRLQVWRWNECLNKVAVEDATAEK